MATTISIPVIEHVDGDITTRYMPYDKDNMRAWTYNTDGLTDWRDHVLYTVLATIPTKQLSAMITQCATTVIPQLAVLALATPEPLGEGTDAMLLDAVQGYYEFIFEAPEFLGYEATAQLDASTQTICDLYVKCVRGPVGHLTDWQYLAALNGGQGA